MPSSLRSQTETPVAGYVDAHVHLWTADVQQYPLAPGFTPTQMQPPSFAAQDLFKVTMPLGIERIVLIQMVFYGFDNTFMPDVMRTNPAVFAGVALVDEHGEDPAADMRRLKHRGVRGVRIAPQQRGDSSWLDGPGIHAM